MLENRKNKQNQDLFFFSIFQSLFYLFPLRSILFPSFYWILFFLLFQILLDEKDCLKFSFFLRKICIAMNRTVHSFFFFLLNPMDFLRLYFHFHLSLGIFCFILWFHSWSIGFLAACCLVSMFLFFSIFLSVIDF